jgi:hypothetical protein
MKATTSRTQVFVGVVFGLLLQVLALAIVIGYFVHADRGNGSWAALGSVVLAGFYFGMAQVLTILPAALITLALGRHGTTRGLLYTGIFLALWNIVRLVGMYFVFGQKFI